MTGSTPEGGEWNLDEENREPSPDDYELPPPVELTTSPITRRTQKWVDITFDGGYTRYPYGGAWAAPTDFVWPVTRSQALTVLDDFVTNRLPAFGRYQDAMLDQEWVLNHSLLSVPLNLGLLTPREVVDTAVEAYQERGLPLNSIEGFVRQIIGWREFMRHAYRRTSDMAEANQLGASASLPDFYWSGEVEMKCLNDIINKVRSYGYSHHIERLMVLANFATLLGVDPAELNEWFHSAYVDAYHWVTTPNVVGMGTYGSDTVSTKPYVSSANYINRMSDYCGSCPYDPDQTTGEKACPFNALYWDFLERNREDLQDNHRLALVYNHLENKSPDEVSEIRDRSEILRSKAQESEL